MEVKVSELKHHPKNKEIYDLSSIEDLMRSISDVGLLQPLVIDPLNQVISGNRRLESIKRLGWEKVNVVIKEVKKSTDLPVGVGFGIKNSDQVKEISNFSDAIVVGSAIVNEINSLKIKNLDNDLIVKNMIDFLLALSHPLKG